MRRLTYALTAAATLACAFPYGVLAQNCDSDFCRPPLLPPATQGAGVVNNSVASGIADVGSLFLWKQLNGPGTPSTGDDSKGGGAAPNDVVQQRFRTWGETYGLWSRTNDFDGIIGDRRRTEGIVGGIGFTPMSGVNFGFAVDQSLTKIAVNELPQNARYNLTQLGATSQITFGRFNLGLAGVYGFANVDTDRNTIPPTSLSVASYGARLWAGLAELGYYIPLGNARLVPKIAADWTRVNVDGYSEVGGLDPATVAPQTTERTRAYAGFEVGQSWVTTTMLFDLSGYARAVDILSESGFNASISSVATPGAFTTVAGATEGHFGADAGSSASVRVNPNLRFYLNADVRLREHYQAYIGTIGAELRW